MTNATKPLDLTIVGAGMIVNDQILPSVYHLQRLGLVGQIKVCDLRSPFLRTLRDHAAYAEAFPGQSFTPYPAFDTPDDVVDPKAIETVLEQADPYSAVVVAIPDQFHYQGVMTALRHNQHVLCVKPLTLEYKQGEEIRDLAREKGLFVGVEYHKRFDRRVLLARRHYRDGALGEFISGEARLIEPYLYRHSNFQNWFTTDQTDPFVYIACHYIDQVYFVTGLRPVEASVQGVRGKFPNGNEAFMWAHGRVRFENGGILSVLAGLGYPDDGAGSNDQGISLFFEGDDQSGNLRHNDQFRGVELGFLDGIGPGGSKFNYVNPDYMQLVPWEGEGLKPVGYGYDSVAAILGVIGRIEAAVDAAPDKALEIRQSMIDAEDERGIVATPANSGINELVQEAARCSILADGEPYEIVDGAEPYVRRRA